MNKNAGYMLRSAILICWLLVGISVHYSCKARKNKSKDKDSLQVDSMSSDSLAKDKDMPKTLALGFEHQKNILNTVYIHEGSTELGTFDEEEIMNEGNNVKRTVSVESFYMDETEIANIHWLEYLFHVQKDSSKEFYESALPDTTVWQRELGYNDFYVSNYLRYPGFRFYPVVGISWLQANDYCLWRTAKVNEYLVKQGISIIEASKKKNKKNPKDTNAVSSSSLTTSSAAINNVIYRLPTEQEWEYAAQSFVDNQFSNPETKHKRIYPWDGNTLRSADKKLQGIFLANFKRGRGDYGGIANNKRRDGGIMTTYIYEYPPNDYGLYNMAGNVNEWVYDEYVPFSFEGEKIEDNEEEEGFLAGTQRYNKAGFSVVSNAVMRVYKGGSWQDVAYWLSPGTRRYLAQDSSTATIGLRCAMSIAGQNDKDKK
ncbi:MAG: gliding motility lipoprotein GldJ [Cytophagaceae bacterium]|nr:gliding motility lipoprotein GldJ [Cytophagaceae bacterium]MDW8455904.1 gliding motility lipoprotein GldJ [Cytophagaceae bacterium]